MYASGLNNNVAIFISATFSFFNNEIIFSKVIPVSIISSRIIIFLFSILFPNPISSCTLPVVLVPKYDESLINDISELGILIFLIQVHMKLHSKIYL